MVFKNDPTTPRSKHANELKVYEKTVSTAIKQGVSLDLNPLIALYGVF